MMEMEMKMPLGEGLIEKFAFVVGFPWSVLRFDLSCLSR
jgi:hypothetical protein